MKIWIFPLFYDEEDFNKEVILNDILEMVYQKFPEVSGKKPVKHNQPDGKTLLVFKGEGKSENGVKIPRIVRVLVDQNGKILKMTTSR